MSPSSHKTNRIVLWVLGAIVTALLAAVVLTLMTTAAASAAASEPPLTVVVLGDSNSLPIADDGQSQRWPGIALQRLSVEYPATKYALQNSSVGGIGSRQIAENIGEYCLKYEPDVVLLMIGTNDVTSWSPATPNPGFASTEESSAAYLETIASKVDSMRYSHPRNPSGHPLLVLMTPPIAAPSAVGSNGAGLGYPAAGQYGLGRPRDSLIRYGDLVTSLGARRGLPVVGIWDSLAASGWSGTGNTSTPYILGGVHLSQTGQAVVADQVHSALVKQLAADGSIADGGLGNRLKAWWRSVSVK